MKLFINLLSQLYYTDLAPLFGFYPGETITFVRYSSSNIVPNTPQVENVHVNKRGFP